MNTLNLTLAACSVIILGQTVAPAASSDAIIGPWAQIISSLGATGVLGWYCWYVTSSAIPKMQERFSNDLKVIGEATTRGIDKIATSVDTLTTETIRKCEGKR